MRANPDMRMKPSRAIEARLLAAGITLLPRYALADGEALVVAGFWDVLLLPWAILVCVLTRRHIVDPVAKRRVVPLTILATAAAFLGLWPALVALSQALNKPMSRFEVFDPSTLSPLVLLVGAAPALWYLWKARQYQWVFALALIPMLLAGSCVGMEVAILSKPR